jgi:hypothetical protein
MSYTALLVFLYRLAKNICKFLMISMPIQLIGSILLLMYLPIQRKLSPKLEMLPFFLRWFDNADMYIGRNTETYEKVYEGPFLAHYTWLAWRNPINYFSYAYLSVQVLGEIETIYSNDPEGAIGDSTGDRPGFRYTELRVNNQTIYEYYFIYKWSSTTCFRFRTGYKIGGIKSNLPNEYIQEVFVLAPYKSYRGQ